MRAAFNSPFWPFVLATTSVGQEGLDFTNTATRWCIGICPAIQLILSSVKAESIGTRDMPCAKRSGAILRLPQWGLVRSLGTDV